MDSADLARALAERARCQGFDAVGVAAAGPLPRDAARLEDWLGRERHAQMRWLEREPEKRADPRLLLPGCRSVVIVAMNYWPGEESARPHTGGRVALYARGRDYHKILGRKLRDLAAWLEETTGGESRAFVDTGPVLERAWAEASGIGWIGKNANLLTRELGSWLLLGEILTTADLAPGGGPHADFCGSCTACLDACPTQAIVDAGVVDSNLCISYWTIEHRGPVPEERRAGIADWLFGCDICQEVCPWNRTFARAKEGDPFAWREDLAALDPVEILAMDESTFRRRFSGTALMRAKWEGMRRNACLVLGNSPRPGALPALQDALSDADPIVRSHAAWALRTIGGPEALELLRRVRATETAPDVLDEINRGLGRL